MARIEIGLSEDEATMISELVLIPDSKILYKDSTGTYTGIDVIPLPDGVAPSPTTNKLYAVGGNLYWNGTKLN